jgi:predicted LPLAT superfamily acyltransferase
MGPLALLLLGLAGWLVWTGRLQRMAAKDGMALGVALVGAVTAAKGKPVLGAVLLLSAALFFFLRSQRRRGSRPVRSRDAPPAGAHDVAQARALLGLPADASAHAIRAAHRRLIASVHPDRGGTQALAAQINAARDLLLRDQKERPPSRPS